jgi:hypothetical protein
VNDKPVCRLALQLPPLDGATAAWLLDLCGQIQTALWREYGDQIEAHWTATEPDQSIFGRLRPEPRTKR